MTTINPKTNRPIRIGGAVWKRLVHDNVIEGDIIAPVNELYVAESKTEAQAAKKVLSKQKPPAKGRFLKIDNTGKRVISSRKPMSHTQIQEYMMKCATKVYSQEKDNLANMN